MDFGRDIAILCKRMFVHILGVFLEVGFARVFVLEFRDFKKRE